ncbi:MAG: GNAT family N-acetyltransferase [Alphaproteobacteria bacterium]|nr:GNAT family N-acetyltransferase [Alphaproteobacteria bacterium]
MNITFKPLQTDHLPLLFKWLEKPHVQIWWDPGVDLTPELLQEKYGSYPDGYYVEDGIKKPLNAFIVEIDHHPVAYTQLYDIRNYPGAAKIPEVQLLANCTGLDIFLGDEAYVGKGYGTAILKEFLSRHVAPSHEACFVDPDKNNLQAIRAYEKAGFRTLQEAGKTVWMMWKKI